MELDAAEAQDLQLAGPHILGVYEDRLSLDLHAVLTLGCVASVAPSCRSRPLAEGYRLQELQVPHWLSSLRSAAIANKSNAECGARGRNSTAGACLDACVKPGQHGAQQIVTAG